MRNEIDIFIGVDKYVKLLEEEIEKLKKQINILEKKNYKILVEKAYLLDKLKNGNNQFLL